MDRSAQNIRTAGLDLQTVNRECGLFLESTLYENFQFQQQVPFQVPVPEGPSHLYRLRKAEKWHSLLISSHCIGQRTFSRQFIASAGS